PVRRVSQGPRDRGKWLDRSPRTRRHSGCAPRLARHDGANPRTRPMALNPSIDLLSIGEPLLEFNQTKGTEEYRRGHGGDSSNAAIAAARQGAKVAYFTALGRDPFGDSFMELWAREGVDAGA